MSEGLSLDELTQRYEVTRRERLAAEAVQETARSQVTARARDAFASEMAPWAAVSEPLFAAIKALKAQLADIGGGGGSPSPHRPSESLLLEGEVTAPSPSQSPLAALETVEVTIQQQMLTLYQKFEAERRTLLKERDEARSELAAMRAEAKAFDEASAQYATVPPISSRYAVALPQKVAISPTGHILVGDSAAASASAQAVHSTTMSGSTTTASRFASKSGGGMQHRLSIQSPNHHGQPLAPMVRSGRRPSMDVAALASINLSRPQTQEGGAATNSSRISPAAQSLVFSPMSPSPFGTAMPPRIVYPATVKESLGMQLHMLVESIASQVMAQHVRLFLFDSKSNLVQAADFPRDYEGAPTLDDSRTGHRRWGRPLRTVAERNMSIIGYSLSDEQLAERMGQQKKRFGSPSRGRGDGGPTPISRRKVSAADHPGDESDGDGVPFHNASKVKCYMCWPVRAFGAPSVVRGALEVVNKRESMQSPILRQFTADDESVVHHAAKTLSAILSRYPFGDGAVLEASRTAAPRVLASIQASNGIPANHIPESLYQDRQSIASVESVVNTAIGTSLSLPVFRGVMHSIRTSPSTVESVSGMATADVAAAEAAKPVNLPHLPASDTASVDFRYEQPTQLTRLDYTLEALNTMWRQEHEENRQMHEQVRYWSGRVRALTDMTKCFNEAVTKVKLMRTVEEIQTYLRSLDLSVRTSNVPTFLALVAEGYEEGPSKMVGAVGGSPTTPAAVAFPTQTSPQRASVSPDVATKPASPFSPSKSSMFECPETLAVLKSRRIELVEEGPDSVRTFTLDPAAKRKQQVDIEAFIKEHTTLGEAIRRTEKEAADGARFTRSTLVSSARELPRRPSWQIEQRHELFEEKRRAERESRVGVPPAREAAASLSPRNARSVVGPSPLVLPERRMYLPAPPHASRK